MNNFIKKAFLFAILLGVTTLCGCGGDDGAVSPVTKKGTATMVFSTSLPAGSSEQFGNIQLVFELPAGVTVPTDPSGAIPNGPGGALSLSGEAVKFAAQPNAALPVLIGKYSKATATSKATINMDILVTPYNGHGMNPGEFATLVCDLMPETTIDLNAFQSTFTEIANITGSLLYQNPGGVTGLATAGYTVTLQYPTAMTGPTSGSGSL